MTEDKRQMKASEIPAFVDEVIGAGCNITAVGHDRYVLGDIEEQDRRKTNSTGSRGSTATAIL
ncbi:hypothetical protein ACN9MC_20645 [Ensifer adhaerens]|jgi:hypothetical protein|uniref:hypothetical protein n=1 Tax=Ensifer adhaerens TaxID=106592 RepID=UPI0030B919A1